MSARETLPQFEKALDALVRQGENMIELERKGDKAAIEKGYLSLLGRMKRLEKDMLKAPHGSLPTWESTEPALVSCLQLLQQAKRKRSQSLEEALAHSSQALAEAFLQATGWSQQVLILNGASKFQLRQWRQAVNWCESHFLSLLPAFIPNRQAVEAYIQSELPDPTRKNTKTLGNAWQRVVQCHGPPLVLHLIKTGVVPAVDGEGRTLLFSAHNPKVSQALLDTGLDPLTPSLPFAQRLKHLRELYSIHAPHFHEEKHPVGHYVKQALEQWSEEEQRQAGAALHADTFSHGVSSPEKQWSRLSKIYTAFDRQGWFDTPHGVMSASSWSARCRFTQEPYQSHWVKLDGKEVDDTLCPWQFLDSLCRASRIAFESSHGIQRTSTAPQLGAALDILLKPASGKEQILWAVADLTRCEVFSEFTPHDQARWLMGAVLQQNHELSGNLRRHAYTFKQIGQFLVGKGSELPLYESAQLALRVLACLDKPEEIEAGMVLSWVSLVEQAALKGVVNLQGAELANLCSQAAENHNAFAQMLQAQHLRQSTPSRASAGPGRRI